MNFLSIDCGTDSSSLFIKCKNKTFNKLLQSDKSSNDQLMSQILIFFKLNNIQIEDISQIFVNQGPGNFSSLRGSLATAKGISLSKNLKLFGYNTFIWSCAKFINNNNSIFSLIRYRKKYFVKKFDKKLNLSTKITEVTKEELIKDYQNSFKLIPKNMIKFFDKEILKLSNLTIVELNHNDLEFLQLQGLLNEDLIKPLYLS
jgi:tRNA threonylcarbamoyl adenosine modification protein YeaZ